MDFCNSLTHMIQAGYFDQYSNLKYFFTLMFTTTLMKCSQLEATFNYKEFHFKHHALILEPFIRKVLAKKYKKPLLLRDTEIEHILNDRSLLRADVERFVNGENLERNYDYYQSSDRWPIRVIHCIEQLAYAKVSFLPDYQLPPEPVTTDLHYLRAVKRYFNYHCFYDVAMGVKVDCEYFKGKAHLIFDEEVMYEIKVSEKSIITWSLNSDRVRKEVYKLLLCSFGYYKRTGIFIKDFVIYNPVRNQELTFHVRDIDLMQFERALRRDMES